MPMVVLYIILSKILCNQFFFEIWVGRYLKFHNKPVVILDPFGIYNPLHELVEHLETENFIKPGMRDLISWTTNVEQALAACK